MLKCGGDEGHATSFRLGNLVSRIFFPVFWFFGIEFSYLALTFLTYLSF